MKYIIASDIHGSTQCANAIVEAFEREKADKIILLGDLYYHGPRNPMAFSYYPMAVANTLNGYCDCIIAIRGNCDADIDVAISDFKVEDEKLIAVGEKKIFLTHGHLHSEEYLPDCSYDVMIHGHTHISYINRGEDGKLYCNPGSVTLPKDGFRRYLVLDETNISLKDLESGETIQEENL